MHPALLFETFEISASGYGPDVFHENKICQMFQRSPRIFSMEHFYSNSRREGK